MSRNFCATARGRGAAPERHARTDLRSYFGVSRASLMAMYRRGTPGKRVGFSFSITFSVGSSSNLGMRTRSEEHTSELQSRENLVCRLLLEKKKKINIDVKLEDENKRKRVSQAFGIDK